MPVSFFRDGTWVIPPSSAGLMMDGTWYPYPIQDAESGPAVVASDQANKRSFPTTQSRLFPTDRDRTDVFRT